MGIGIPTQPPLWKTEAGLLARIRAMNEYEAHRRRREENAYSCDRVAAELGIDDELHPPDFSLPEYQE